MVDSVTTMGCSRSTATKKPLNAPAAMPMAMPAAVSASGEADAPPASPSASAIDQRDHRAGRQVEAAGQDHQRRAHGGDRQRMPPLARKDRSK